MYNVGDMIVVKASELPENKFIIGKAVEVVEIHGDNHPYWVTVDYCGDEFSVKGTDCGMLIAARVEGTKP